jgi:hypothetical protein
MHPASGTLLRAAERPICVLTQMDELVAGGSIDRCIRDRTITANGDRPSGLGDRTACHPGSISGR